MDNKKNQSYFEEGSGLEYIKVYKDMINQHGIVTASVFAVIANYSKYSMSGDRRCCTKSEVGIGNDLQLSWTLIRKSIKILLENNLIEKVNKSDIWGDEKLNSANWYRPVSKNVYELKDQERKPYPKSNYQRSKNQKIGRKKIKENKENKKKKINQNNENTNKHIDQNINKNINQNQENNDEYSW
jgi:hypothetical protein